MDNLITVTTTFSDREEAVMVADQLVRKRLVACAQVSDKIESIYWWKDEITRSNEYLVTFKTKNGLYKQVEETIKKMHSYDTPEIVAFRIAHVEKDYGQWVCDETQSGER